MSRDFEVGIKLIGDGKGLVGEVRAAKEALSGLGETAKRTNTESAAAAERFTATLRRQADTIGMTASQTRAYDASQLSLNSAQRASVEASNSAIAAYDRKQQTLERLRYGVTALTAAVGTGLVMALKSSATMAAQAEQSHLRLQAVLSATGYAAGLTKAELDSMAESMKGRLGIDDDALRDSMAVLLTFKNVSRDSFGRALESAADLAAVMQTDLKSAVLQLGKALENPEEGLTALKRSGVSFSDTQKAMIVQLVETGRQGEALALVLDVVESQVGGVAEAMNQGMTKATRDAGLAWDDLLKSIGNTGVVKGTVETVFGGITGYLRDMKQAVDSGDWLDRLKFLLSSSPSWSAVGAIAGVLPRAGGAITPAGGNAGAQASADALAGLTRQQLAQDAEIKNITLAKQAEEAAKKREAATQRAAQATAQAIESSQRYAAALKLETEQAGLNTVQKRMMAAAAEAAKAPTLALRQEIMAGAQAWAAATQAQEGIAAAEKARLQTIADVEKAETAAARATAEAARTASEDWSRMWSTAENTGRMAFTQFAAHGVGAIGSIKNALKFGLIDMLYQLTARKWLIRLEASLAGSFAAGAANAAGGGIANAASGGLSLMNMASGAGNIFSAVTGGLTSTLGSGIAGLGSLFGSSAVSAFGAGLAGSAAGIFSAAGGAGTAFIGGAGTAIGGTGMGMAAGLGMELAALAGPLAAIAGIGALLYMGFKKKKTPLGSGIQGDFSDEGFAGTNYTDWKSKSWFSKAKYYTTTSALDPEVADQFGAQFAALKTSSVEAAKILGLSADSIMGYSKHIKLALTGDETKNQALIDSMFGGIADELALKLMPNLKAFQNRGESLAQTFARLADESAKLQIAIGQGLIGGMQQLMGLADQMASLYLSDLSPLTAAQRLATAGAGYSTVLAQAQAGDLTAAGKLGNSAQEYLREGRSYYSSSQEYSALFNSVQSAVGDFVGTKLTENALGVTALRVPLEAIVANTANLDKRIADILAGALAARASTDAAVIKAQTEAIVHATLDAARVQVSAQQAGSLA